MNFTNSITQFFFFLDTVQSSEAITKNNIVYPSDKSKFSHSHLMCYFGTSMPFLVLFHLPVFLPLHLPLQCQSVLCWLTCIQVKLFPSTIQSFLELYLHWTQTCALPQIPSTAFLVSLG